MQNPSVFGIPVDFILFGLTLAGVAVSSIFPEAKSVAAWVKGGWFVVLEYLVGFAAMLAVTGWHPQPQERPKHGRPESVAAHVTSLVRNKPTWQRS